MRAHGQLVQVASKHGRRQARRRACTKAAAQGTARPADNAVSRVLEHARVQRRPDIGEQLERAGSAVMVALASLRRRVDGTEAKVDELLSIVEDSNGGTELSLSERERANFLIEQLCRQSPTRPPLDFSIGLDPNIFGTFSVLYSSSPTAAGGKYRNRFWRQVLRTDGLYNITIKPNVVSNIIVWRLLGIFRGNIALVGYLSPGIDGRRANLSFERPEIRIDGLLRWRFSKPSTASLSFFYCDKRVRLAIGRQGSYFVFRKVEDPDELEEVYERSPQLSDREAKGLTE